jgi:hypothetical protein
MTKKEINQQEIKQARSFRKMGYTFRSLVAHYLMESNYTRELEQRLLLIDESGGKVCLCSAMVNDQEVEGNTVPLLYCVIMGGKDKIGCPYAQPTKEELEKALELHDFVLQQETKK